MPSRLLPHSCRSPQPAAAAAAAADTAYPAVGTSQGLHGPSPRLAAGDMAPQCSRLGAEAVIPPAALCPAMGSRELPQVPRCMWDALPAWLGPGSESCAAAPDPLPGAGGRGGKPTLPGPPGVLSSELRGERGERRRGPAAGGLPSRSRSLAGAACALMRSTVRLPLPLPCGTLLLPYDPAPDVEVGGGVGGRFADVDVGRCEEAAPAGPAEPGDGRMKALLPLYRTEKAWLRSNKQAGGRQLPPNVALARTHKEQASCASCQAW